jgi:hypothetical protein
MQQRHSYFTKIPCLFIAPHLHSILFLHSICLTRMNQLIYRAEMTVLSIVRQSGQRLSDYIDLIDQFAILHYN